nr:MAG TPA: hypothetical protein [Bacteriophage sp.]DAW45103.1 MAG TPA: hypothetical protein [Bacteriophage sp.]
MSASIISSPCHYWFSSRCYTWYNILCPTFTSYLSTTTICWCDHELAFA